MSKSAPCLPGQVWRLYAALRSQQPFANPFKIRFASQQVFEAGVNSMLILFTEGMIGDICL